MYGTCTSVRVRAYQIPSTINRGPPAVLRLYRPRRLPLWLDVHAGLLPLLLLLLPSLGLRALAPPPVDWARTRGENVIYDRRV